MSKKIAHAPYNFVPLPEKIIKRYESFEQLPTHNVSKTGEENLLSGEVTFDIVAKSPILVADGTLRDNQDSEYNFIRNARGNYEIPGSTLRGLFRNTVSILSLSNWTERIDKETFFYRTVGESGTKLANYYREIVGAGVDEYRGRKSSIARNVKAGYLVKQRRNHYVIYPARTDGGRKGKSYYKYHINNVNKNFRSKFREKINKGFLVENCKFAVTKHGRATYLNGRDAPFKGKLVFSGPMFGRNKKQSAYIINEIDKETSPIPITIEDLQIFQADYEFKKSKFSKGKRDILTNYFSLPEKEGIENGKPCFYIQREGKLYFGFTAFLRIPYDYATTDALPERLKKDKTVIDYEKALFGFTNNNFPNDKNRKNKTHYASRLQFMPSEVLGNPKPQSMSVTLRSPRASALPMYLKQDLHTKENKSYNDKDAEIKGMKQYWIKDISSDRTTGTNKLKPLPDRTTFSAKIKFEHLYPDELGLLLWAIKGPTYQQIGMGKPYGLGKVTFVNVQCDVTKSKHMYQSLEDFYETGTEKINIDKYIEKYKGYVESHYNLKLEEQESIQVFFKMKEDSPLNQMEMKYMPLRGGYDQKLKLPTANQLLAGEYKKYL